MSKYKVNYYGTESEGDLHKLTAETVERASLLSHGRLEQLEAKLTCATDILGKLLVVAGRHLSPRELAHILGAHSVEVIDE